MDQLNHNSSPTVYWRVEGSLLDLTVVRPVAFFTWNAQTFTGRLRRRGLIFLMAVLRPILYATNRKFATRMVHTVLRGVSKDRLDLLGEEYFQYKLKPHLKDHGAEQVRELVRAGADVVLVSQALDHIMRPLAEHLGVKRIIANRLDFRSGIATGRLLEPVIRPRGAFAPFNDNMPDGRRAARLWRVIWTYRWMHCDRLSFPRNGNLPQHAGPSFTSTDIDNRAAFLSEGRLQASTSC